MALVHLHKKERRKRETNNLTYQVKLISIAGTEYNEVLASWEIIMT